MSQINMRFGCECGGEFSMVFEVTNVATSDYLDEEYKREHCCPHCCKRQPLGNFKRDVGGGLKRY